MTTNTSPASPGSPVQIVAESRIRAPLAGNIPWATPTLSIPIGNVAQIVTVPNATIDATGGKLNRRS
jgi:hypothetical protein